MVTTQRHSASVELAREVKRGCATEAHGWALLELSAGSENESSQPESVKGREQEAHREGWALPRTLLSI